MTKTLIAITTYQKTDAFYNLVESLVKYNYHAGNKILVTDDNAGKDYITTRKDNPNHPRWVEVSESETEINFAGAPKVVENLKRDFPDLDIECVFGEKRGGVAINKNRGIKYFLEHLEFDELLMLDDDIVMTGPGLLEACRATGEPHMTGLLGGSEAEVFGADACPFFQSFPPKGETPTHWFCTGSMGMMLWYKREAVEKAGYFNAMPDKYGAEHSLYSCRLNALYGKYIDWFPILKGCEGFFISQSIPNNYTADYEKNMKFYNKIKPEIFKGINLHIKNPGC